MKTELHVRMARSARRRAVYRYARDTLRLTVAQSNAFAYSCKKLVAAFPGHAFPPEISRYFKMGPKP